MTIGKGVILIESEAFSYCTNLTGVYFTGDAPALESYVFYNDNNAVIYYLPGTSGWEATFGNRPTAHWLLPQPLILGFGSSFGVKTNQFGFVVSWATNLSVVVEAAADVAALEWSAVATNTLSSGSFYFTDSQWTNYPARFYRIRSP